MEKRKLIFEDGYQNIEINGDPNRVIRINPTDAAFLKRISSLGDRTQEIMQKYGDIDFEAINRLKDISSDDPDFEELKAAADNIDKIDKAIRELIDSAFDSPVCDIVFGNTWCISPSGGKPVYMNFLEAMAEYIGAEFINQNNPADKLNKYTETAAKYSNRQQRRAAQKKQKKAKPKPAVMNNIDIGRMSEDERKKLLVELINLRS